MRQPKHPRAPGWLSVHELDPAVRSFVPLPPPNESELSAWRLWMAEVFMPLNLRLEKIIVENGDLVIEEEMPPCLLDLCAHVAAYKAVLKKWDSNDFSEMVSVNDFPRDLLPYAESSYVKPKRKQTQLLGRLKFTDAQNASLKATKKE